MIDLSQTDTARDPDTVQLIPKKNNVENAGYNNDSKEESKCKFCFSMCKCLEQSLSPPISDSTFFGPTLDETILHLIAVLPFNIGEKLGIVHSVDQARRDEFKTCCKRKTKSDKKCLDLSCWLDKQYKDLACDAAKEGLELQDDYPHTPNMLQARRFVLNRLAELMEMKQKIELSGQYKKIFQ